MKRKDVLAQEECIHGVWPPNCCTICSGKEIKVAEEHFTFIVARWEAKFPSKCYRCGESIEVGDKIAKDTDDDILCERCSA